jgi:choline dehydrogenase
MSAPPTDPHASVDYIVVGAGSAGCALAHRLSENARVLLLERGGPDSQEFLHDPSQILQAILGDPNISVPYMTGEQSRLAGRNIPIHRGIVRGGCSSINGMAYIRGNREDYNHWAGLGNDGWSYQDVLPYFLRSERYAEGASEYHGASGPLDVRPLPNPSPAAEAFVEAAGRLPEFRHSQPGFDFNGPQQQNGAGLYRVTVSPEGRRASAAVAFLDPLRDRSTLRVETNTFVTGIAIEGRRAVGVRCQVNGEQQVLHAEREVILAAGAFESPRLLLLSGIGPAAHLRMLGIQPLVDLPGVGQNLQDHLMMVTYWPCRKPAGVSTFIAEAGLFLNSATRALDTPPDLQYHFLAGMAGLAADPIQEPNFLFCPTLVHPHSRGEVRLQSLDPRAPLMIQPNYLHHAVDCDVLVRGMELARELDGTRPLSDFRSAARPFVAIARDGGMVRVPLPEDSPGLRQVIAEAAQTTWHPAGTCKMGRDPLAVVDPLLRVYGVDGLRVADASIMPVITRGNTNAPAIMIGERAAALMSRPASTSSVAS